GRIVFVGSVGGRSALPFLGAYAASKFALEAVSDSLRVEVAPWGIQVSIVEPGTIATPMWTKPQPAVQEMPPEVGELYGARIDKFRSLAQRRSAARGAPPDTAGASAAREPLTQVRADAASPVAKYWIDAISLRCANAVAAGATRRTAPPYASISSAPGFLPRVSIASRNAARRADEGT